MSPEAAEELARVEQQEAIPRPGIHKGMSFEEYTRIDAVNHSKLEGFRKTPAHARELILRGREETEALATGHALHLAVLEPDRFASEFAVGPQGDRRTKAVKAAWADFELTHPHATLLDPSEYDAIVGMRASIMRHPTASELLSGKGLSEVSLVWKDSETARFCKSRPDRLTVVVNEAVIVELKTAKDASEREFQKAIANFGYHRQGAMQREGMAILRPGPPRRFVFVAVEKTRPYCVAVHELEERALEQGYREWHHHLRQYHECMESGVWPGYGDGMSLVDLPAWAVDKLDLESEAA